MNDNFQRFKTAFEYSISIVALLWIIRIVESFFGLNLASLGVLPRSVDGLLGIITAPFIHSNFQHLIANTIPFLILSTLMFTFYKRQTLLIFILLWVIAGFFTWLIGRPAWHIGASIIIYALAFFLFFGGIMSRKFVLILVSVVVLIFYGGLVYGMFPGGDERISWEGHLSGALSGFICAYWFRKEVA